MNVGISSHRGRKCPYELVRGVVVCTAGKYLMCWCPALLFPLVRNCTVTMQ